MNEAERVGPAVVAPVGECVRGAWVGDMAGVVDRVVELDSERSGRVRSLGGAAGGAAAVPGASSGWASAEADERRVAWVYLSRVVEGPCAALSALIDSIGVIEAARAVRECELPEALRGPTAKRRESACAERDLELVERLGGRVVTPDDAEWPTWRLLGLRQLTAGRDQDGAVPLVLWVRGSRSLLETSERALAVVGARSSTPYGDQLTREMVSDVAAAGWTVVSGAAYGIDAMAHRAALACGAPTIAVLACGVDRPYPAEHDRLLAEIADFGLIVSEYPPGTVTRKHQFLARNRLIAALADGVLVVEAGLRSGARNTVKWARRLGRPAMAVPGSVNSASSVGCHHMIRDGEALLVTRSEEVINEAGPLQLPLPGAATPTVTPEDALTGDEARVFAALPKSGYRMPVELAGHTNLPLPTVRATLAALELAELVGVGQSGWYRLTARRRRSDHL